MDVLFLIIGLLVGAAAGVLGGVAYARRSTSATTNGSVYHIEAGP